jgi:SRSO17 transposase
MLIAHLTFVGAHEHNILSTQMSFDPTLISLTQSKDRKNMIVANSIVTHVPSIYEMNALFNNDLTFDWINYTTSVGADYLISLLNNEQRQYQLSINDFQVIYPVELMSPKEFGFEPFSKK